MTEMLPFVMRERSKRERSESFEPAFHSVQTDLEFEAMSQKTKFLLGAGTI